MEPGPPLKGEASPVGLLLKGDVIPPWLEGGASSVELPLKGETSSMGLLLKREVSPVWLPSKGVTPSWLEGVVLSVGLPLKGEASSVVSIAEVAGPSICVRRDAAIERRVVAPCMDRFFFSSSPMDEVQESVKGQQR